MYIKRYSLGSMLLLTLMGWAIFAFISHGNTGDIEIFNDYYIPSMPFAIASLIPAVALFILTISHMSFYSIVEYFRNRSRNSDFEKLEEAIRMNLAGETVDKPEYKSSLYKDLGELLNISKVKLHNLAELDNGNKFQKLTQTLTAIQRGAVLELDSSASYHIKELNYFNALKKDPNIAEQILMERGFYNDELYIEAFNQLCKVNTYPTIQRYIRWFNIEALFNILARVDIEEDGISLEQDEIVSLINSVTFTKNTYTKLAKVLHSTNLSPDFRIELFKSLIEVSDDAVEGYLYTLLNLEMISEAESMISELQAEHLTHIRAFIILKKADSTLLDIDYFIK